MIISKEYENEGNGGKYWNFVISLHMHHNLIRLRLFSTMGSPSIYSLNKLEIDLINSNITFVTEKGRDYCLSNEKRLIKEFYKLIKHKKKDILETIKNDQYFLSLYNSSLKSEIFKDIHLKKKLNILLKDNNAK